MENRMSFGYYSDGTINERESEVVRFVFQKSAEYFRNLPQELIDEAYAWAAYEGEMLTEEEAKDLARMRIDAYILQETKKKFPDVTYRESSPETGYYPVDAKYPSRAFKGDRGIDAALYDRVIMRRT